VLALAGCVAGIGVALWLTQALVARLTTPFEYVSYALDVLWPEASPLGRTFRVNETDAEPVEVIGVGFAALYLPARWAAALEPAQTLRSE
jgi:hypothetical protein